MKKILQFLACSFILFAFVLQAQPVYYNYNTSNATNNAFPFSSNPATGKSIQHLYLPGAFNLPSPAPSGLISKISFMASSTASATYTRLTIKMGLTTDVDLPPNAWYTNSLTTVFDSTNYTLSGTTGQFSTINLQTLFLYDSTKSLIVEVTQCGYSGVGIGVYYTILSGIKRSAGPLTAVPCPHPWGNQNGYSTHTGLAITTTLGVVPISGNIPSAYLLKQNYPNPFNPATEIHFGIPKTGFVSLVLYDMLGREVRQLVSEELQAGEYSYTFNASSLPSGVYMYVLRAGDFSETKKMMLIK